MKMSKIELTPFFDPKLYEQLPEPLKECCQQFDDPRERDVFLLSALAVLSGCFSNASGKYGNSKVHPNIYVMIVAPPGSGKNVMKFSRILAEALNQQGIKTSPEVIQEEEPVKDGKKEKGQNQWVKVLLIPGNTSSAMIYQHLKTNNGIGIIVESETDTLSNSLKQEWGNFSDILRKAFHHETLSMSRKTDHQYFEVSNPRLSIVLTGTPGQVGNLIGSSENGLMSRFTFYVYNPEMEWKSQKPCDVCPDLTDLMREKAEMVAKIAGDLEKRPLNFKLTERQFNLMDDFYREKVEELKAFGLEDAAGTIFRMGITTFRMCMVLSILRKSDQIDLVEEIVCEDIDFEIIIQLADALFYHALEAYKLLPKNTITKHNPGMMRLFSSLPDNPFSTAVAHLIGETLQIKERTVRKYLADLCDLGFLEQLAHGKYQKMKKSEK